MPRRHVQKNDSFGAALRAWRRLRAMTQEDLADLSGSSTRHISFLETGRSQPSRDVVLCLAESLNLPLREQNALLEAAGLSKAFHETDLGAPEMAQVSRVLGWILEGCEPNGAAVLNRSRDVLQHNPGWRRQMGAVTDLNAIFATQPLNTLRLLFHPLGLRNALTNWEAVAGAELSRLHTELRAAGGVDDELEALLEELLGYPDVPDKWLLPQGEGHFGFVLPMQLATPFGEAHIFSTITSIGAPRDVTLQELRVQAFAPADAGSEAILARLGVEQNGRLD